MQDSNAVSFSIIIPAKNEAKAIGEVVATARAEFPEAEIIVVDDGSEDATAEIAKQAGANVISHPESLGNGAAVKHGARVASGEILAFMDGDGQHDARELGRLIERLEQGYDMAIGARDTGSHANVGRLFANGLYNAFASMISGHRILDLTSGFRVTRASLFKKFLYLLPIAVQEVPVPAAQWLFLPHHDHHGVSALRLPGLLRAHSCREAQGQEPYPAAEGRSQVPSHHLQDRHAVCAFEDLLACQRRGLCHRAWLLLVYFLYGRSIHEHVFAAVQRIGDHFPDWPDLRADYCAHVRQVMIHVFLESRIGPG
jgi:glycosyltransferase involved in cell wall biosynthesis